MYDMMIIGAGPAGITASIYAARNKMNFCIITKDIGGQAAWSGDVENYTGYQLVTGAELVSKFEEQMRKYNSDLKENEEVKSVRRGKGVISVETTKGKYETRTLLIASGKKSKELNVPGEKEFKNKGLTYCATCDGPLFTGKDVAVIGGGNSALDAAMQLVKIVRHMYIINISPAITGEKILADKISRNEKVAILNNARVTSVFGNIMVEGISVKTKNEDKDLPVQGVFVEIGLVPNSDFAEGVEKNERMEIKVNCHNETNLPGVFACGDVTDVPEKQIVIAAGEGAKAALSAFRYLSKQE